MTTLREAAQQALEALEKLVVGSEYEDAIEAERAITALRAALAEPVQEPVAWRFQSAVGGWAYGSQPPLGSKYPAYPLYTAPLQRKPLTDEEILKAVGWDRAEMYMKLTPNFPVAEAKKETLKNARAIERAHGIGGQT